MASVDITEFDYELNGTKVVSFKTVPQSFPQHVEMIRKLLPQAGPNARISVLINRERLKTLILLDNAKGETVQLDDLQLMKLPIKLSRKLLDSLNDSSDKPGEIVKQGDGITNPIIYKLGKPLTFAKGESIAELEFHCQFYGDVEEILAEDLNLTQALLLIQKAAKPVGSTLQAIPESALNQLSLSDGAFITAKILPSFLE